MHFITEDELRQAFQEAPFERYELTGQHRLTPGARGFLFDRKIPIIDLDAPVPRILQDIGEEMPEDASLPDNAPMIRSLERFLASLWEEATLLFEDDHTALEWMLLALERVRGLVRFMQGKSAKPKLLQIELSPLPEGLISVALFTHPKGQAILTLNRLARESAELAAYLSGPEVTFMEEVAGLLDQGIIALYGGGPCQK